MINCSRSAMINENFLVRWRGVNAFIHVLTPLRPVCFLNRNIVLDTDVLSAHVSLNGLSVSFVVITLLNIWEKNLALRLLHSVDVNVHVYEKKSPHVIQWSKIKWILSLLRLNCSLECLKMATRFIYIKQYIDTRSLKTNVENVRILLRVWFIDFVQFFKDICTNTGYKKKLKKSKIVFYFHVVIFFIDFQFLLKKNHITIFLEISL